MIKRTERNYSNIIIAGFGGVGRAMLTLDGGFLESFDSVLLVDIDPAAYGAYFTKYEFTDGDIRQEQFLYSLLKRFNAPILFVNLCSGIDTVVLRKRLADWPVGYVDICASEIEEQSEYRFSQFMPYTNQSCHGKYPHLICQGINPGLVEYAARMLMEELGSDSAPFHVEILENDQMHNPKRSEQAIVGWCVEDFLEEMLESPSMEIVDGSVVEDSGKGSREILISWDDSEIPARIVGHEDVWNLGQLGQVQNCRFIYGLHENVMNAFKFKQAIEQHNYYPNNDPQTTNTGQCVTGLEEIRIQVRSMITNQVKCLAWREDHGKIWKDYGLNAVQYQTSLSALMSLYLMQFTSVGRSAGTWNSTTLPLKKEDFKILKEYMDILGIKFENKETDPVRTL